MCDSGNFQWPIGACCPLGLDAANVQAGRPCRCDEDWQLRRLYEYLSELPMDFDRGNQDVAGIGTNCNGNNAWGCGCGCGFRCGCWPCCGWCPR